MIHLLMLALIVCILLGMRRLPPTARRCHCPYGRRHFFDPGDHTSPTMMAYWAGIWLLWAGIDLISYPYAYSPWWWDLADGLLTSLAVFYALWLTFRLYYHEYATFRRLKRRVLP